MDSCCAPGRATTAPGSPREAVPAAGATRSPGAARAVGAAPATAGSVRGRSGIRYVELPGGRFAMGDPFGEGYPADGERPVHPVTVSPFAIAATTVTNAQFATFVAATGYRTDAERFGSSAVFHLAVRAAERAVVGPVPGSEWWIEVRGADWAHPGGPRSSWRERPRHPVVHVSWFDAQAFCAWAGARLPTEAEWEYAARGGHEGRRFPWGDELEPGGEIRCNIWHGTFPTENTLADGFLTTAPVRTFAPNDHGLYQTSGNVWEWCADWFSETWYARSPEHDPAGPGGGSRRSMRGGSHLCHHSYCSRYRLAARYANTPDSSAGNVGFRTVRG